MPLRHKNTKDAQSKNNPPYFLVISLWVFYLTDLIKK